jgi:hypothetical protein
MLSNLGVHRDSSHFWKGKTKKNSPLFGGGGAFFQVLKICTFSNLPAVRKACGEAPRERVVQKPSGAGLRAMFERVGLLL